MPVYNAGSRVGPPARSYVKMDDSNLKEKVYKKTLVWILARLHCTSPSDSKQLDWLLIYSCVTKKLLLRMLLVTCLP